MRGVVPDLETGMETGVPVDKLEDEGVGGVIGVVQRRSVGLRRMIF